MASRIAEGLRILGNKEILENLKDRWRQSLVPSFLSRIKFLALLVKSYTKTDLKVFLSCPILFNFLQFFSDFRPSEVLRFSFDVETCFVIKILLLGSYKKRNRRFEVLKQKWNNSDNRYNKIHLKWDNIQFSITLNTK